MIPGLGLSLGFSSSSTASNGPFSLTGGGKGVPWWGIAIGAVVVVGLIWWSRKK